MTKHTIYTLSNVSATKITPNGVHSGIDITLQNINVSGDLYVGGEGVTTEDYGYKIMPSHAISFELPGDDDLYVIAEINSAELAVMEIGLE